MVVLDFVYSLLALGSPDFANRHEIILLVADVLDGLQGILVLLQTLHMPDVVRFLRVSGLDFARTLLVSLYIPHIHRVAWLELDSTFEFVSKFVFGDKLGYDGLLSGESRESVGRVEGVCLPLRELEFVLDHDVVSSVGERCRLARRSGVFVDVGGVEEVGFGEGIAVAESGTLDVVVLVDEVHLVLESAFGGGGGLDGA